MLLRTALLLTLLTPGALLAQTSELTSADRLALLYSSQMQFDPLGEPIVKVGIDDGLDQLTFDAKKSITVLPTGPTGPSIELPRGRYTVAIDKGVPGAYAYHVVLDRFSPSENPALHDAEAHWHELGLSTQLIELGSLFAIAGEMFDTRQTLLVTEPWPARDQAQTKLEMLEATHGLELSLHAELSEHPTGLLTLTREDGELTIRHDDVLWIQLEGEAELLSGNHKERHYTEMLVFTADRQGQLALVNAIHVEEVLRGVVPAELYASAPLESLKAQAVAARGTLVAQIGVRHLADPYNLCDEVHCQVFGGMNASRSSTDKAVEQTRGRILFDGKRIAETFYSSNCGGMSEIPEAVWGLSHRVYLHAHTDDRAEVEPTSPPSEQALRERLEAEPAAHCNTSRYGSGKHFRWSKTLSAKELNALVAEKHPDLGTIQDISIVERGPGGRIVTLELIGSKGRASIERELTVRRLFGGLKSGQFVLDIERDHKDRPKRFIFTGGGFGHGVGMCQTGAMNMAHDGSTVSEILGHYYQGADLKKVW